MPRHSLQEYPPPPDWTPESWRAKPASQDVAYDDPAKVAAAVAKLKSLPPLVTSWEIERLRGLLAEAETGERFMLQGGDCAETLADCTPALITSKLKILLQMSLVLVHGSKRPVIRVGRFAGQYAKPRSSATETRQVDGKPVTLPSYFGDLYNTSEFTPESRRPNPHMMVRGYQHAAMTLNFIRSLLEGGFADLHHPEYWDLSFFKSGGLSAEMRAEYEHMTRNLADGLRFMEALGESKVDELARVEFFTSHEGLNLLYESAQTRKVPRREGFYDLTTHLPWVGERTRAISGAHIEFFRGIRNPVGVKVGPSTTPTDLVALVEKLNPHNEAGKLVLITRMGAGHVAAKLPPLVEALGKRQALWVCDPMHGNGMTTPGGVKTRSFEAILTELEGAFEVHRKMGTVLGGVHFELTGEDVTECVGGAAGVTEDGLSRNYNSLCDPRLNYQQSLEMAFLVARRMGRGSQSGKAAEEQSSR